MAAVIHLDTHAVIFLYAEGGAAVPAGAARRLERCRALRISPMVRLEMQYLHEIERLVPTPLTVLDALGAALPLAVCDQPFQQVATAAEQEHWTRDPFDRLIVAQARLADAPLLTRDRRIHAHYDRAFWDE